jgi:diadenosine tetraphosphate (Ap4A) HIT family hydrolase
MNQTDCIFCNPKREILAQNTHGLAFFDSFPVSRGHALIVPKRHVVSFSSVSLVRNTPAASGWCFR